MTNLSDSTVRAISSIVGGILGIIFAVCMFLILSPKAHASPGGFLQGLSEDGIVITNAQAALRTGILACGALDNGYAVLDVAAAVKHDVPSLTDHQAGYVVGLAIRELCPSHYADLRADTPDFGPVRY